MHTHLKEIRETFYKFEKVVHFMYFLHFLKLSVQETYMCKKIENPTVMYGQEYGL